MYRNTPYRSFEQIEKALRGKEAILRIAKGQYARLFREYAQDKIYVAGAFLSQFLFPLCFLIGWYLYTKEILVFLAVPVYLLLPFLLPGMNFLAVGMTAFGLFGLIWHWHEALIALLLPGLLCYFGVWLWQQSILVAVCRKALGECCIFEKLWDEGLIAIQDKDGIYGKKHSGSHL